MQILRDYVQSKKLTQDEFAKQLGKSQGQVSHWLNGTRKPSTPNLLLISEKTGISATKLLKAVIS
jgi:transcriptional regulator with XRE-family HTH domain